MARRLIPRVCAAVFVVGIAGLIVSSVAGNNNGVVLSIGGAIVVAAIALLLASDDCTYMTGSEINLDGGLLAGSAAAPG